jgi:formylglycine-generating enzyme required for sulfatase activity
MNNFIAQIYTPGINSCNYNRDAVWSSSDLYGRVTTVGSNGGPSAYGTYDQSGQLYEWNDLKGEIGEFKGARGGSFLTTDNDMLEESVDYLSKSKRLKLPLSYTGSLNHPSPTKIDTTILGFRIVSKNNPLSLDNFVLVEDINNNADSTGFGSVPYSYYINKYMVTNDEYVEFLNAKAKTDTYALYNPLMSSVRGGIDRSGSDGNYIYSSKPSMGNKPVNYINWFMSIRYCNWLSNGKENGDTESGSYKINLPFKTYEAEWTPKPLFATNTNIEASYRLPTEDEWYKAAYYKGNGTNAGYWKYATQSDETPLSVCASTVGDGILPGGPCYPTATPTSTPAPTATPSSTPSPTSSPTPTPSATPPMPDFIVSGNKSTALGDSTGASPFPPSGWTTVCDGNFDSSAFLINLPFNWIINNTSYNSLYINSNNTITFGGSSTAGTGLSASNPPFNKIFFGAANNSVQRICTQAFTDEYFRIRFEGTAATSGTAGSPNIIAEIVFYNPAKRSNFSVVEIMFGEHARSNGLFGVANTTTYYINSVLSPYNSYVFVGTGSGTYFQLYESYHVEDRLNDSFLNIDCLIYDNSERLVDSFMNIDCLTYNNSERLVNSFLNIDVLVSDNL